MFGAVLRGRFDGKLNEIAATTTLPEGVTAKTLADRPAAIHDLADPLRTLVQEAMAHSVAAVFLAAVPIAVVVFVLAVVLEELPLRTSTTLNAGQSDEAKAEAAAAAAESLA